MHRFCVNTSRTLTGSYRVFLLFFSSFLQMFLSALIDVAGHAGNLDDAFEILQEARNQRIHIGIMSYSSLMGACCNVCITEAVQQKSSFN